MSDWFGTMRVCGACLHGRKCKCNRRSFIKGLFPYSDCVNGRATLFRKSERNSFTFAVSGSAFNLSRIYCVSRPSPSVISSSIAKIKDCFPGRSMFDRYWGPNHRSDAALTARHSRGGVFRTGKSILSDWPIQPIVSTILQFRTPGAGPKRGRYFMHGLLTRIFR